MPWRGCFVSIRKSFQKRVEMCQFVRVGKDNLILCNKFYFILLPFFLSKLKILWNKFIIVMGKKKVCWNFWNHFLGVWLKFWGLKLEFPLHNFEYSKNSELHSTANRIDITYINFFISMLHYYIVEKQMLRTSRWRSRHWFVIPLTAKIVLC